MGIPRATTPTITLTFTDQDLDLTAAENVYVTFEQVNKNLTKTGEDLTVQAKQIDTQLSQEETLAFVGGPVKVQANWTDSSGNRFASDVEEIELTEQLLEEVVE